MYGFQLGLVSNGQGFLKLTSKDLVNLICTPSHLCRHAMDGGGAAGDDLSYLAGGGGGGRRGA